MKISRTTIGNILMWIGGVLILPALFLVLLGIISILSFFTIDIIEIVSVKYAMWSIASFFWGLVIGVIGMVEANA